MPELLSTDQFVAQTRSRAENVLARRQRRRRLIVAVASATTGFAVVVGLAFCLSDLTSAMVAPEQPGGIGTVLSDGAIAAYILMGVVCFAAGVVVTLVCQHHAGKGSGDE